MATPTFKFGLTPSTTPSWTSGGTAGALDAERAKATFSREVMTNLLDGSAEMTKKRRWIVSQTEGDDFPEKPEATRSYSIQRHLKSFIEVHKEFAMKGAPSLRGAGAGAGAGARRAPPTSTHAPQGTCPSARRSRS